MEKSKSSLVRGTFILTLATAISKILGFIYVVPFMLLVGTKGNILFEYAYKPYILLLSMATLGIPMAVSKFVSKYNELGDYKTAQRLFKSSLIVTSITGLLACLVLNLAAPSIAEFLLGEGDASGGNTISEVVFVIQMVSFALLVVPPMAITRGFFQGHQSMAPTAVSQVIEQLVRIVFILVSSYIIIHVLKGEIVTAVGFATFAACLGAIAGSFVLMYYWMKRKGEFLKKANETTFSSNISLPKMYLELVSYAVPFIIIGLSIPFYQSIDTFTINAAMMKSGASQLEAETVNSIVSLAQKVILIPVSLATAFGLTLVPAITKSFTGKDFSTLHGQITKTFQLIFFLVFPAAIGLTMLGDASFASLFGLTHVENGGKMLSWYGPMAIFLSVFTVTSAMLQGINKQYFAVGSLFVGLLFKLLSNYYFVAEFGGVGSAIATDIGFSISILINMYALNKFVGYNFKKVLTQGARIFIFTAIMALSVFAGSYVLDLALSPSLDGTYTYYISRLLLGMTIGGSVYLILGIYSGIIFDVLGERFAFLKKLDIRKRKSA